MPYSVCVGHFGASAGLRTVGLWVCLLRPSDVCASGPGRPQFPLEGVTRSGYDPTIQRKTQGRSGSACGVLLESPCPGPLLRDAYGSPSSSVVCAGPAGRAVEEPEVGQGAWQRLAFFPTARGARRRAS